MNLLCCFKIVPDLDKVVSRDWQSFGSTSPDLSYAPKIIGCYDEAALETALRIKDSAAKVGDKVKITAVTAGNGSYDYFLRGLFAVGVDRIVQIRLPEKFSSVPEHTAAAICSALDGEHVDAVLCGVASGEASSGKTPYLLAKELSLPCLPNVTEMRYENGLMRVRREICGGSAEYEISTPAVYAVGNCINPYLRMPTVKKRLAAAEMTWNTVEAPIFDDAPAFEILGLSRPDTSRGCVLIEGESCGDKARELVRLCPEVRAK